MFHTSDEHEQERLISPLKNIPPELQRKRDEHWSTPFYQHFFTQIDEEKFAVLYHDGYSRPNKSVAELVSLLIIKENLGLSDQQLEDRYLFDLAIQNALGKEGPGDNICQRTFTNFRRRLLEFEEETGRDLMQEVFDEHRDYLVEEFDIDTSTQRMDTTFIEANIKQLCRIDLVAKVLHTFLTDLPDELLEEVPEEMGEFAGRENLSLSYQLDPGDVKPRLETLVEHAAWLIDRFDGQAPYCEWQSFAHLQRVIDEQCYRIPALEADDEEAAVDDHDADDDEDEPPGWTPLRSFPSNQEGDDAVPDGEDAGGGTDDTDDKDEQADTQQRVQLADSEDIDSDALQNPHDEEATYREKHGDSYQGYKTNLAETCDGDNPFRLITAVQVATNNTEDTELLAGILESLATTLGLEELFTDGGFQSAEIARVCRSLDVAQHLSGIKGENPDPDAVSVAEAEFDGQKMVACPEGHQPIEHEFTEENERHRGRMDKSICANCPRKDDCFVEEREDYFSYGFYQRHLEVAQQRAKVADPDGEPDLNLRAGAESMINEVTHKTGKRATFTGNIKVKNAAIARAIGTNVKRVARYLEGDDPGEQSAAAGPAGAQVEFG